MSTKNKIVKSIAVLLIVAVIAFLVFFPSYIDKQTNRTHPSPLPQISEQAIGLHKQLFIGDWHSDSLMWKRDLSDKHHYGHVDIPRLQQGNVALQMFTTVTKSPSGLNYDSNSADAGDNITKLALVNMWPSKTWSSLTERALYQASRLQAVIRQNQDEVMFIDSKSSLQRFINKRKSHLILVGALLGTEGSHALDGDLDNIQRLFESGFRMMSLQHFFDNKLGGSLHGITGNGLSEFGHEAVRKIQALDIILDLSHSSQKTVEDVLKISTKPMVISHTGFYGHCPSARNISDDLMKRIADRGGLIAVGYWDGAVCEPTVMEIAKAIKYGVALVGSEHVALGSDYDGATSVPFDTSELIYLTQALLDEGLSETQIKQVMGSNTLRFLQANLPD